MNHTPGPWYVDCLSKDSDPKERHIVTAGKDNEVEVTGIIEKMDDAVIISRVPDMHKALRSFIDTYELVKPPYEDWPDLHLAYVEACEALLLKPIERGNQ